MARPVQFKKGVWKGGTGVPAIEPKIEQPLDRLASATVLMRGRRRHDPEFVPGRVVADSGLRTRTASTTEQAIEILEQLRRLTS